MDTWCIHSYIYSFEEIAGMIVGEWSRVSGTMPRIRMTTSVRYCRPAFGICAPRSLVFRCNVSNNNLVNSRSGKCGALAGEDEQLVAPPSPSDYVVHCNREYGIPYLVDFGLLHDSNAVDISDATVPVNMTYDEDLLSAMHAGSGDGNNRRMYLDDGLPVARLRHPQGSSVDICLHGAVVTSWKRPDGSEMLALDPSNKYDGQEPIVGGLGAAWPQLGAGALPCTNGVLQYVHWSVMESSCWDIEDDPRPSITLYADSEDVAMSKIAGEFSHPFEAMLTVTLGLNEEDEQKRHSHAEEKLEAMKRAEEDGDGDDNSSSSVREQKNDANVLEGLYENDPTFELTYQLTVMNKSTDDILTFTTGAMANLATEDLSEHFKSIKVNGLVGKYVLDYSADPMRPVLEIENDHFIKFDPSRKHMLDRLYVDCPKEGEVLFCPGTQHHFDIRNEKGFSDILLYQDHSRITIAAARKAKPVRLQPGQVWEGQVTFKAFDRYWNITQFEMDTDAQGIPVPPRSEALPPRRAEEEI